MDTQVVIAGAGPVGLMLAAELRLHGVGVIVVEPLTEPSPFLKAFGLHSRSTETMELRGLVGRLEKASDRPVAMFGTAGGPSLAAMKRIPLAHFAGIRTIRLGELATSHPGLLAASQVATEAVLLERAVELGAEIRRGFSVVDVAQNGDGVLVEIAGSAGTESFETEFLVGCDGGRSAVRKLTGYGFPGSDPTITGRLAEVAVPELIEDPGMGWHRTAGGVIQIMPGRVLTVEFDGPPADRDTPMTVAEMSGSIRRLVGRDVPIPGEPTWLSRFTDNTRLADTYRRGRVLLAGDAAHVHSPFGGQGLNLGLQDAANLGWKLAAEVAGWAPSGLLDTYQAERRPVAARVLHNTRAQVALMNPDPAVTPLRELFTELMELEPVNRYLGEMITALDVRYDLPGSHPLTGGFMPDLVLADGRRAREFLAEGRPVLFDLADDPAVRATVRDWSARVDTVTSAAAGPAMLVRPDGYVAWAGGDLAELRKALTAWFGN